jgi:hypothetical protein
VIFATAFVLFCALCTVLAFVRHPIWGVYFYLATTYVYPPGRWWGYIFGNDIRWALLAAMITALAVVVHRGKLQAKPSWLATAPTIFLGLYTLWMAIQIPWAMDPDQHVRGMSEIIKCLLAMWFVYRALDSKERVTDLMVAHVMGCALLGVFAFFAGRYNGRVDGVGGPNLDDSNTLGMYLVTAAIVACGLVFTQKGWKRLVALVCLPLIVNGFVLANSRGAFLGLVGGGLVLAFCTSRNHRRILWAFSLVGAIGLAIIVDKTFIDRMFTIQDVASQDEEADSSARSRLVIAKAQLEMFFDYPMGIGWRGTEALSPTYMDDRWLTDDHEGNRRRSSHNTFLTTLTEQGIPGALIYSGLVMWVLMTILRIRRFSQQGKDPEAATVAASLAGALCAVFFAGFTADYLTKEVQFWLYAGLVSIVWLTEPSRKPSTSRPGQPAIRQSLA